MISSTAATIIDGGTGNDKLRGGSGEDIFVFDFDDGDLGRDRIYDFDSSDSISFVNIDIAYYTDLLEFMTQSGNDVSIEMSGQCDITIHDINLASLTEDSFMFA